MMYISAHRVTMQCYKIYVNCFHQHGEPGAAVADIQPVDVIVTHVLNQILSQVCYMVLN